MPLSSEKLDEIAFYCQELSDIISIYEQLQRLYPESNGEKLKALFLWCIREFMSQNRLKYLGELKFLSSKFGDEPDKPTDIVIDGLTQPHDPSPEGVTNLIRSKWPPEVEAYSLKNRDGFPSLWFLKWQFVWLDKEGNPIYF